MRTGFESGAVAPLSVCSTQNPNEGSPAYLPAEGLPSGPTNKTAMKARWTQTAYNGTRDTKGVEFCLGVQTYKEAWIGFNVYLPSGAYPKDKEAGMFQIFQNGGCSSWAAMLVIKNNALQINHRSYCGSPTSAIVLGDIPRDRWVPIVVHFVASHASAGTVEVWADGAPRDQPSYRATGINFGFGNWNADDTLASDHPINFKFGQYDYDAGNYTAGETRTSYYDDIHLIPTGNADAWNMVQPAGAVFAPSQAIVGASSQGYITREAVRAFDGNRGSLWMGAGPASWLLYRYPAGTSQAIASYTLTSSTFAQGRDPKSWELQGSNDGLQWTALDRRSGEVFSARGQARTFRFTNTTAYAWYRLNITASNGENLLMLAEFKLGD